MTDFILDDKTCELIASIESERIEDLVHDAAAHDGEPYRMVMNIYEDVALMLKRLGVFEICKDKETAISILEDFTARERHQLILSLTWHPVKDILRLFPNDENNEWMTVRLIETIEIRDKDHYDWIEKKLLNMTNKEFYARHCEKITEAVDLLRKRYPQYNTTE